MYFINSQQGNSPFFKARITSLERLQVLYFVWFVLMKYFFYKSVRHTKAYSVLLWFPHWQVFIYFSSYFLCAPYFLCVIHFLSHAGNSDILSAHSPKLTSEAYQKMPFLFASDQRTWTLVLLSFIKTNFQILWCTAASRVLVSVFLNHTWPQTFSHCFFVRVMEKHCLNETNRKMLQYPFTAKT